MKITFQEIDFDLGLKKLWIIRNSKPVIDFNFNLHQKVGHVSTFDFSTPYTEKCYH